MCAVPGCIEKPWGHVDKHGTPHAPTLLRPYTSRCTERCKCGRVCAKANGHSWECSCHFSDCHEPSCRNCGVVIPVANEGRCQRGCQ